jgi:hypothetical protein
VKIEDVKPWLGGDFPFSEHFECRIDECSGRPTAIWRYRGGVILVCAAHDEELKKIWWRP